MKEKYKGKEKKYNIFSLIAILIGMVIIAIASSSITYVFFTKKAKENISVYIQANGSKEITADVGTEYKDQGAVAFSVNTLGETEKLATMTTGTVDITKLGTYELTYSTMYDGKQYVDTRIVRVIDNVKPTIKANIPEDQDDSWLTGPREVQITAQDNYDGNITSKIIKSEQNDKILYKVTDSSGNTATLLLRKPDKIKAPQIEFSDNSTSDDIIYTFQGEEPVIPEVFAVDGNDNELTDWIQTEGTYDINTPGTYQMRYFISNYEGEVVELYRTIIVEQLINPDYILNPNKIIRLSFEEGPNANTTEILNILDKYNAKATFFIGCWNTQYLQLLQSEKKAGHAVGIYSYDSDPKQAYGDIGYFRMLTNKAQKVFNDYTGANATIMRFPGGSKTGINTMESIMAILRQEVESWGLKYFDWTIDPLDTINDASVVYQMVITNISPNSSNIVKLHDSSDATVKALEDIITWGLKNGYTFIPLA